VYSLELSAGGEADGWPYDKGDTRLERAIDRRYLDPGKIDL